MNRAVSGHYQPGARENVAYLTSTERRKEFEAQAAQEKREYDVSSSAPSVKRKDMRILSPGTLPGFRPGVVIIVA